MPFEDFYKAEDQWKRRWRKCISVAVFCLVIYCTGALLLGTVSESNQAEPIVNLPEINLHQRVDELCAGLPRPEKFYFTEKENFNTDQYAAEVIYYYRSERSLNEIMPAFIIWFQENGWTPIKNAEGSYEKGIQYITISEAAVKKPSGNDDIPYFPATQPQANFQIFCTETVSEGFK